MRDLIELQTGQVAFISGLMSGFALSVAAHVLRYGMRNRMAQLVFLLLLLCSLLFLVALYVDVRLSIELAGIERLEADVERQVNKIRVVGTSSATVALFLFVVSIGLLGWLAGPLVGFMSTVLGGFTLYLLWLSWTEINSMAALLASAGGSG